MYIKKDVSEGWDVWDFAVKKNMGSRLDVAANNQPPIQSKMVSNCEIMWHPSPSCPQD